MGRPAFSDTVNFVTVDEYHGPRVAAVNGLVGALRLEKPGILVPYVAPIYNAANASILSLSSDPGPMAGVQHGSGVLSILNDDESATRMGRVFDTAGLSLEDVFPWNAYPWYQHEDKAGDNSLRSAQISEGVEPLRRLLIAHPRITWIVAHGGNAHQVMRRASKEARFAEIAAGRNLRVAEVRHTSRRAFTLSPKRRQEEFRNIVNAYVAAMEDAGLKARPIEVREPLISEYEPVTHGVDIEAELEILRHGLSDETERGARALVNRISARERADLLVELLVRDAADHDK